MTSNLLRILGILVLIVLIFVVISTFNRATQPATKAAVEFMNAVNGQDLASVEQLMDTSVSTISHVDNTITGIEFKEQHVFPGSFSKASAVKYSYLELTNRRIPRDAEATMTPDNKMATVPLEITVNGKPADGGSIYLREVEGQWKIFYIEQPKEVER
ncbi:MAG: hypothetical protein ACYDCO_22020 [Armatimonadota bacterium]